MTTWKTDNPGASEDFQIKIGTNPAFSYNYDIDWGDGTSDSGVTGDITHDYGVAGTFTVSITGIFPQLFFANGPDDTVSEYDNLKLLSVEQWGDQAWESMERAFYQCKNLEIKAQDIPDLSRVSTMKSMFEGALAVDYDFGPWDVSNVTNFFRMFRFVTLSTANYDSLLVQWSNQALRSNGITTFDGGKSRYSAVGREAQRAIRESFNWIFLDYGPEGPGDGLYSDEEFENLCNHLLDQVAEAEQNGEEPPQFGLSGNSLTACSLSNKRTVLFCGGDLSARFAPIDCLGVGVLNCACDKGRLISIGNTGSTCNGVCQFDDLGELYDTFPGADQIDVESEAD